MKNDKSEDGFRDLISGHSTLQISRLAYYKVTLFPGDKGFSRDWSLVMLLSQ